MERGICFVHSTPPTPEATQNLLEKIGPIRNTHYGGFYDFVPNLALKDTAYTNEALAPHTDTTYFTEPAGLQAFHMLSHHAAPGDVNGSSGGLSIFVDGFNAVSEIYERDPLTVQRLMQYPIPWHASGNDGISITPDNTYPVIEGTPRYVHRIRWNNDDRGSLTPSKRTNDWYKSARVWQMILDKPENQFQLQLEPGRVVSKFLPSIVESLQRRPNFPC
jgi:trimethyllysine dioxygenase